MILIEFIILPDNKTIFINPEQISTINRAENIDNTIIRTIDNSWLIAMPFSDVINTIRKAGVEVKICKLMR